MRALEAHAFGLVQEIEGASHAAEHAKAEHVDLRELQRVDIGPVRTDIDPFDEQLDDAGLLGREGLIPERIQSLQRGAHVVFSGPIQ